MQIATTHARWIKLFTGAASVALLSVAAGHVQAAEAAAAANVEEVVVTGSRIRGVVAVGSNIASVSHDDIIKSGTTNTSDLLRKVPQIVGLGPSATASAAQNGAANSARAAGVNLRGIGVLSTLLLFDGRRLPADGTQGQLSDPSFIPSVALDRVEVVADGASAIYGSDAVTGVVNLILRRNFQGVEVNARYGAGDSYHDWSASILMGKNWGSGSAMLAYEHSESSAIDAKDRDFYRADLRAQGGRDYRVTTCNPGTITVGGGTYAVPAGGVTQATAGSLVRGTTNLCDTFAGVSIIPEMERNAVVFSAHQDLGDRITVFTEGFYGKRAFTLLGAGTATLAVPSTNPFFVLPTGVAATSETVAYSFLPVWGSDHNPGYAQSYQMTVGGTVKLFGDWKTDLTYGYGRSDDKVKRRQNINTAALTAALNSTNPATAFNPFGPNSAAVLAPLRNGFFIIGARTGLHDFNAQADGSLFQAPGGPVRLAVGVEYRKESLVTNLVNGSAVAPVTVHSPVEHNVKSAYAELYVPLVGEANAMPGVKSLGLSLAGRYDDYSDFGNTTNPKVGLTWEVNDELKVRASYGKSFRAPGLAEYDAIGSGAGLYQDTLPGPNGNQIGIGIAGGNKNLVPETATTYSVGFDFQPKWLPGAQLGLTYFDIDYQNQILGLRGTPGLLTLPIYSQYVKFNPTQAEVAALIASGLPINTPINPAVITYIQDGRRQNLGATIAQGFDLNAAYSWKTESLGDFEVGVVGSYFTHFKISTAQGVPTIERGGVINYPQQYRYQADLQWTGGPWRARGAYNYTPSYINNTGLPAVQKVDSYATVDLRLAYDLGEGTKTDWLKDTTIALDVSNAFDEDPPFVDINSGYDPQSTNPVGRVVAVSIRKSW